MPAPLAAPAPAPRVYPERSGTPATDYVEDGLAHVAAAYRHLARVAGDAVETLDDGPVREALARLDEARAVVDARRRALALAHGIPPHTAADGSVERRPPDPGRMLVAIAVGEQLRELKAHAAYLERALTAELDEHERAGVRLCDLPARQTKRLAALALDLEQTTAEVERYRQELDTVEALL